LLVDSAAVTLPIPPEVIDSANQAASTPIDSSSPPGASAASGASAGRSGMLIPVVGIKPEQLQDTYNDARSGGRVHDAIDIIAPRGTPVVAAVDGEIVKLFQSERGGTTLYQRSPTGDTIFYYAHLDRYADGIAVGKILHRGELLGYVGETGNVVPGNAHLHFAIWLVTDPKKYWDGENINPYPLLR
jgi:murein DD-endopeptidase MepM/ murein hydrolase activator NlpD